MGRTHAAAFLAAAIVAAGPAHSDSEPGGQIAIAFASDGATIEGRYRLSEEFSFRVPLARADWAIETLPAGDGEFSIGRLGIVADYAPGGGALRITGGAVVAPAASSAGDTEGLISAVIDGFTGQPGTGLSPIVSLGYNRDFGSGWSLSGNLTAVVTGTEETGSPMALMATPPATGIAIVPYMQVGLSLRF